VNGRRRHLVGIGLVGVVILAAATLLDGRLPDDDADPGADPFMRTAAVGERIDLRTMEVTVESVQLTPTLVRFGVEMVSPGVWVVVEYTVVASDENTSVSYAELRGDGRAWALRGRGSNDCSPGPPGVPVGCVAYIEVPLEVVPDLRLWLARDVVELRYDAVADVDLGLTSQDADRGAGAPPLEVPGTWLGERP
jgi:hypothetical protein